MMKLLRITLVSAGSSPALYHTSCARQPVGPDTVGVGLDVTLPPTRSISRISGFGTELKRFGEVLGLDVVFSRQIRDRSRHSQDAIEPARR